MCITLAVTLQVVTAYDRVYVSVAVSLCGCVCEIVEKLEKTTGKVSITQGCHCGNNIDMVTEAEGVSYVQSGL